MNLQFFYEIYVYKKLFLNSLEHVCTYIYHPWY